MNVTELKTLLSNIEKLPILDKYEHYGETVTIYGNGDNGTIKWVNRIKNIISFLKDGVLHNEEGPAKIMFSVTNNGYYLHECIYYLNGLESRENDPSRIFYRNNKVSLEYYKIQGKYNPDLDKPCIIEYYDDGKIAKKTWCNSNTYHRENGPAVITYNIEGNESSYTYYYNGQLHYHNGFAFSNLHGVQEYYLCNEHYSKQGYEEVIANIKLGKLPTDKDIKDMTIKEIKKYMVMTKNLNKDLYEELEAAHLMLVMLKNL